MNKVTSSLEIYNKINEVLKRGDKKKVARLLGMTPTNFSRHLKALQNGKGIETATLQAITEVTGFNFFKF